ncbi:hypothetical protein [Shewanella mangrovisoli]|uniref:Peptidase M50 n=1 Tax=Shewanella mangrovisoli TaxID=2864211 RepID=A0ABV4VEU6_9GAMM
MTKQVCIFEKQYSSLVDFISDVDDRYTVRTEDDRFFNFDKMSASLLRELETNDYQQRNPDLIKHFVEQILVEKGIYRDSSNPKMFEKKQPALSIHQTLLTASLVNRICSRLHCFFQPLLAVFLLAVAIVVHTIYIGQHIGNFSYTYIFTYSATDLLLVLALSLFCSLIHEFGHASACHHFAGRAGEIGTGINMLVPVFFANVSNIYTLTRRKKAIVSISGLYFQMLFGSVVMVFAYWYGQLDKFITLYFMGFVFSLLPVYRNDGYWFINDLSNRHDLLSDSVAVIRRKKTATALDILYSLFFVFSSLLVAVLVFRFLIYSGPTMFNEILSVSEVDFQIVLKSTLLIIHYIAIFFFFYALAKTSLGFVFKTQKPTGINKHDAS